MDRGLQDGRKHMNMSAVNFRLYEKLRLYMELPLEDELRGRAYDECTYPKGEVRSSCACADVLFVVRT